MSDDYTNKSSETDWEALDALRDEDIDLSEILDEEFFKKARLMVPREKVTLEVDADVLRWFKSRREDLMTWMNAAMRVYAIAHKRAALESDEPAKSDRSAA